MKVTISDLIRIEINVWIRKSVIVELTISSCSIFFIDFDWSLRVIFGTDGFDFHDHELDFVQEEGAERLSAFDWSPRVCVLCRWKGIESVGISGNETNGNSVNLRVAFVLWFDEPTDEFDGKFLNENFGIDFGSENRWTILHVHANWSVTIVLKSEETHVLNQLRLFVKQFFECFVMMIDESFEVDCFCGFSMYDCTLVLLGRKNLYLILDFDCLDRSMKLFYRRVEFLIVFDFYWIFADVHK